MMKKLISTPVILSSILVAIGSAAVSAQQLSPTNVIERPLVLADGELAVGGVVFYGEETNGDNTWQVLPTLGYGVTDKVTIGFGGIRYQFMEREQNKTGLEMAAGLGLADIRKIVGSDYSYGASLELAGKYVVTSDTALNFGIEYIRWLEESRDDRTEVALSVGFEQRLYGELSMFGQYTYSDLHDFNKNESHAGSLGLNYTLSKQSDIGAVVSYSDFDALENGYNAEHVYEKTLGMYYSYRF